MEVPFQSQVIEMLINAPDHFWSKRALCNKLDSVQEVQEAPEISAVGAVAIDGSAIDAP